VSKPEGKRPLGSHGCGWEDNIKTSLREIGWGSRDWVHLAHNRDQWRALVNTVMSLRVPQNFGNLSSCATGGFPQRTRLHGVN
jgi:hypothetical protein